MLSAGTLLAAALLWTDPRGVPLPTWTAAASLGALAGLVLFLGFQVETERITFVPVTALMAYLVLGLPRALPVLIIGLAVGGLILTVSRLQPAPSAAAPWWARAGDVLAVIGRSGLGLLAGDAVYRAFGAAAPLLAIRTLQETLPLIAAAAAFMAVHAMLHIISMALCRVDVRRLYRLHYPAILGVRLLPLPLAPLAALMLAGIGLWAFLLLEVSLLSVALVVQRLAATQDSLEAQVERLQSISAMGQALRATLEVDALLTAVHLQVASLLKTTSLRVLLAQPHTDGERWVPQLVVERGRRLLTPPAGPPDGFTAWVLKHNTPLLAQPVYAAAQRLGVSDPPQARGWLGVPLAGSKRLLGCLVTWLDADEQPGRNFTPGDLDLLRTIGTQAGVALENALLYAEAQQRAAQLARLNQISTEMNASLSPERLLGLVASSVIEVAGCDKAAIYLLDEDPANPALHLTQAQGFSPEHLPRSRDIAVPLTEGERQKVLDSGEVVTVADLNAPVSAAAHLLARREDFAAYAYLPLRVQQRMIGMLAVYYNRPHYFAADEIELLETFANQAALAVVNARVYESVDIQLARRVDQIVRMAEISQRLSATLDLDQVFKLIIDSAIEGCRADAGVLVLSGSPELGFEDTDPHMVAWRGFDPTRMERAPHHIAEELAGSAVFGAGESRLISADDPRAAGPRSQLAVPISVEGKVIGALAVESEMLNAFSQEDLSFVSQLAVQAAVAIRNAQLYRRAQIVRDRLHAVIDSSNDGLLMIDPRARIIMTNTRMGDFWDFAREDFSPRGLDDFLADPLSSLGEGLGYKQGELTRLLNRAVGNPGLSPQSDLYVTRRRPGQRQMFVQRTATPVRNEEGRLIGMLLVFRDVTEQKELDEARQQLTSMIVHELRSPLQAVMGSMRLIGETAPKDNPLIDQATSVSKRAVKKLLNLVNNLLDLSRMEQGEFELDTSRESLNVIVQDALAELMPLAQEYGAVVKADLPPDDLFSEVDRDMIERVVLNLLDNAVKYTPPGTLITVKLAVRPPNVRQNKPMACISVADSGPGIPDEYKERIFDSFAQVPGRKGSRRSSGLGLAFSRMAVESHGGRIWVEDNAKRGSVFCFTLPLAPELPPEPAEDSTAETPPKVKARKPRARKPPAGSGAEQP